MEPFVEFEIVLIALPSLLFWYSALFYNLIGVGSAVLAIFLWLPILIKTTDSILSGIAVGSYLGGVSWLLWFSIFLLLRVFFKDSKEDSSAMVAMSIATALHLALTNYYLRTYL